MDPTEQSFKRRAHALVDRLPETITILFLFAALLNQGCTPVLKWPPSPLDHSGKFRADLEKVAHYTTEHPPKEVLANLGTLGITSADYAPLQVIVPPAKGAGQGAARGAEVGAYNGAAIGLLCYYIAFACSPAFAITGALGGSVYGAIAAPSASTVEESESAVHTAIASVSFQESMRHRVLKAIEAQTDYPVVLLGPKATLRLQPQGSGAPNTLLETTVVAVYLTPDFDPVGPDPYFRLRMIALASLLRVPGGAALKYRAFEFASPVHRFADLAANRGQLLLQVIEQAQQRLADDIVYWVYFPLTH